MVSRKRRKRLDIAKIILLILLALTLIFLVTKLFFTAKVVETPESLESSCKFHEGENITIIYGDSYYKVRVNAPFRSSSGYFTGRLNFTDLSSGETIFVVWFTNDGTKDIGSIVVNGMSYTVYLEGLPGIDSSLYNVTIVPTKGTSVSCNTCRSHYKDNIVLLYGASSYTVRVNSPSRSPLGWNGDLLNFTDLSSGRTSSVSWVDNTSTRSTGAVVIGGMSYQVNLGGQPGMNPLLYNVTIIPPSRQITCNVLCRSSGQFCESSSDCCSSELTCINNTCIDPSAICPSGYICLNSITPIKAFSLGNVEYKIELISATDTSATIKVTNQENSLSETKDINEGQNKTINGVIVHLEGADENINGLSATIKIIGSQEASICPSGYTCLDSNNSIKTFSAGNVEYKIKLVSVTDTSATIEVTNKKTGVSLSKQINEGQNKTLTELEIYVKSAEETSTTLTAVIKISYHPVEEISTQNQTNGTCSPASKCKYAYYKGYQSANCQWSNVSYCAYGCSNGICNSITANQTTSSANISDSNITIFVTANATNYSPPTISAEQAMAYSTELTPTQIKNITLSIKSGKLVYSISGIKKGKLFAIIAVSAKVEQNLDADSGEIISTKKPWWSFLASGI